MSKSASAVEARPTPGQDEKRRGSRKKKEKSPQKKVAPRRESSGSYRVAGAAGFWYRSPWKYLMSLRIGLVLLSILTIASIGGTLIEELERAQAVVYYSWWYKLLLLALATNMGFATAHTIVRKVLPTRLPHFHRSPQFYDTITPAVSRQYAGSSEEAAQAFRSRGFKVALDGDYGYAWRGLFSRWGAPISHFGLIIVLLAGFVSSFVAREGYIQLFEGMTTEEVTLRTDPPTKAALGFTLEVEDFDTGVFAKTNMPSHFISTVTASDEGKVLYAGPVEVNHSPKIMGWALHQTSYQEEPRLVRYLLSINHEDLAEPVEIELGTGQKRMIPEMAGMSIELGQHLPLSWILRKDEEKVASGILGGGGLKGGAKGLMAVQFEPDFVMNGSQVTSRSGQLNNPALKIALVGENGEQLGTQWLFGRDDFKSMGHTTPLAGYEFELGEIHTGASPADWDFHVQVSDAETHTPIEMATLTIGEVSPLKSTQTEEAETASVQESDWAVSVAEKRSGYRTVLSVTRNPMIPIIYFGCGLMMLGLMVAFFIRRRQIYFWVDRSAEKLHVAGVYRHPREELDSSARAAVNSIAKA